MKTKENLPWKELYEALINTWEFGKTQKERIKELGEIAHKEGYKQAMEDHRKDGVYHLKAETNEK